MKRILTTLSDKWPEYVLEILVLIVVISGSGRLTVNFALAGIMTSFAAFSMFKTSGSHYSQLAAIFLFAPASVFGGVVYLRKKMKG